MTTEAATSWLRALLGDDAMGTESPNSYSTRSARATLLSWAAKAGLPIETRRLLGGHADPNAKSALEYSRDALAGPLNELRRVVELVAKR